MTDRAGPDPTGKLDEFRCPTCNRKICGADISAKLNRSDGGFEQRRRNARSCNNPICHQGAGHNTDHPGFGTCSRHFGRTRKMREVAAQAEARTLMRMYGVPAEDPDPGGALREEIGRTVGHVRWLAEKIASLGDPDAIHHNPDRVFSDGTGKGNGVFIKPKDEAEAEAAPTVITLRPEGDDALVWGVSERETQTGDKAFDRTMQSAGVNVWLQIYQAERGHLVKAAEVALKNGVESKRLEWAEAMADRILSAFEQFAAKLGLDPTDPQIQLAAADSLESLVSLAS